ncbi:MAG TPA: cytochrome C [candidate division Zixibacteria bacterium]|nr:cytochrome c [candidate division Zixibacteria bacterium]MDD4916796.1 cytochrome C [candidate division Zixibacteria bacterium]MDM7973125.1 cytochrome C [candidate division Zixibacteria bacterium]HOD65202.1 cytochrome C [candidate division Zixibacteria bacterium]HOZ09009.1 cytochrome C [candidate division Zixibacteria bacterium]
MAPLDLAARVPRDLSLPLPLDPAVIEVFLVVLFLLHIVFVNLMVGGSLLTVVCEIVGRSHPRYDALARRIGATITVSKSLAVVLGVGPLLCINLLYTLYFYSANALTGYAWISLVPLVITAFLLSYLHKYTWERWTGPAKNHHIVIGAAGAFFFLMIPLIFLANINLMLFPDQWSAVRGFFSSLQYGNVFPRYFHFLTASLAVTGLFLAGWFGRRRFPVEQLLPAFTRAELRGLFYRLAFWATAAQLVFGPLLLLTLPLRGISWTLLAVVGVAAVFVVLILALLWRETRAGNPAIGRRYGAVIALFTVLALFMATGRHLYRETALSRHRLAVADRTATFAAVELAARMRLAAGLGVGETVGGAPTGPSVFSNCAACHALDKVLAAPSIKEIYSLYANNPAGIVQWAKNPGKKRPQFQPMPSMAHLGDEKLQLVADYMLSLGGGDGDANAADQPAGSPEQSRP